MPILGSLPVGAPGSSDDRSTVQQLPVGSKAFDKNGNEYTYVKAGAAIAAKDAVRPYGSALGFDDVRPGSALHQGILGCATAAFSTGEYGFILSRGVGTVKTANSTAAGTLVASSATAGTLGVAAATDVNQRAIVTVGALDASSATNGQACLFL